MAKRNYMNDSDSSNNCPPSKKQKLSNMNEEKKEIEEAHETVTFQFKADDMINNEQKMVDRFKQLNLQSLQQKVFFAKLLFHTLKAAGICNGEIETCIKLLFEKTYDIKVTVIIDADEASIQNDESEDADDYLDDVDADDDLDDVDADDDLDDVDADDDLAEEISQTPEAERCSSNSHDQEFINDEGDENDHMIHSDEDCEETYEADDDSSYASSSSNSHQREGSSSPAF